VDEVHKDVAGWFDNVHPNHQGTRIIADVYFGVLAGLMEREEPAKGEGK